MEKSISGKKDFEMKTRAVLMKCWITSKTAPFVDKPKKFYSIIFRRRVLSFKTVFQEVNMITEFGKELRKLRLDCGEILKDMALVQIMTSIKT